MIKIKARFVKRLYGTADGDFSVISAEPVENIGAIKRNKYGTFTINGNFSIDDEEIGNVFTLSVEEDINSKFPNSYKFLKMHYEFPDNAKEQWKYLKSGNLVSPVAYNGIKNCFKSSDKILDIMMNEPGKLEKVPGIGKARAERYKNKLQSEAKRAVIFTNYGDIEGVGPAVIKLLVGWKVNVDDVVRAIEADPFSIMGIGDGKIGFLTADRFRAHYNVPLNDKNRILHGVAYYLGEKFKKTGDTYEDVCEAGRFASSKLFVSYEEVMDCLVEIRKDVKALEKYGLKMFGKNITTIDLYKAELLVYQQVQKLIKDKKEIKSKKLWESNKGEYLEALGAKLSSEQDRFLSLINDERIVVLLGPGGSGKSWVTDIACKLIKKSGLTYGLYAPTARAAHVMTDYTGTTASTIHRGLMSYAAMREVAPYDILIVDESSMVDSELAAVIMEVLGTETRLIIIGDDFQLQSVGPGNILFDIVEFLDCPTVRFDKIYRQGEGSYILNYAQDLREGEFKLPISARRVDKGDIVFINESDEKAQRDFAIDLYKNSLKKNKVEEIMLLSPVNKGYSGRTNLNKEVQEIVNPSNRVEIVVGNNRTFRVGDYITVTKNVYDMVDDNDRITEIINGDMGEVVNIVGKTLTFESNGHNYTIDKSEILELIDHAWSITIHKSQGGQANEVIIVIPRNAAGMLNANMLYTAITRAKVKCTIIGDFGILNTAAREQANFSRKTMLQLQVTAKK